MAAQQRDGKVYACAQRRKARSGTIDGKGAAAAVGSSDVNDKGDKAERRGSLAVFNKEAAAAETAAAKMAASKTVTHSMAKHKGDCAKEGGAAKGSSAADRDRAARKDDVSIARGAASGVAQLTRAAAIRWPADR